MLSSRSYMRDLNGQSPRFTVVGWTVIGTVAVFVLQNIAQFWFKSRAVTEFLGADVASLLGGQVWKLLTYAIVHDTGNLLHVGFNMLMLVWTGRAVLDEVGTRRWLWLYWSTALAGSLLFALLYGALGRDSLLLGASAAVYGLMGFLGTRHPERPAYLFVVELQMRWIVLLFGGIALFGMLVWEFSAGPGVAHSAHLAGLLAGAAIAKWDLFAEPFGALRMPEWWKRRRKVEAITKNYSVNLSTETSPANDSLRTQVDRILDKINSKGFQSLTPEERETLDKAKDLLSKP